MSNGLAEPGSTGPSLGVPARYDTCESFHKLGHREAPEALGGAPELLTGGEVMKMRAAVFSRTRFETDEAFTTAQELGLDFSREPFDLEEFRKGMDAELAHGSCDLLTDVTHNDPVLTAKLVLAHLRKRSDYYTRLIDTIMSCAMAFGGDPGGWSFAFEELDARAVPFTDQELECHEQFDFSLDDAETTAAVIGIDFSQEDFDAEDLRRAMNVELEHGCCHPETNLTHCDPILTAKLGLAHLRERRDFYEHLREVEGDLPR